MKKFIAKRVIEHLLEAAIFAGNLDNDLASKISELTNEAVELQEKINNSKFETILQEDVDVAEAELKGIINE